MTAVDPLAALQARAKLKSAVRAFFGARAYLEVDTPVAVACPGTEVHLRYFPTEWLDYRGTTQRLFLRSSPELHMKQTLALGAERIFQMAPCFRSGGEYSEWHHPEFTMLEWYEAGLSITAMIAQTEELLRFSHDYIGSSLVLPKIFERVTVAEAFHRWVGVELCDGDPELARKGTTAGAISLRDDDDFETAFFKLLIEKVEPGMAALGGAVLMDYPASQAALATVSGGVAKRFEFYIGRIELCNGFDELLNVDANQQRLTESNRRRAELGYEIPLADSAFMAALAKGIKPCSGNALGLDRWLALLLGLDSIAAVIPFRLAGIYASAH